MPATDPWHYPRTKLAKSTLALIEKRLANLEGTKKASSSTPSGSSGAKASTAPKSDTAGAGTAKKSPSGEKNSS